MRSHRSFYSFIILFISYAFYFVQIFSHANTIFENFISQYEDDDDVPQLSADTLKALQEFYAETEDNCAKIDEDWVGFKAIYK